jgi:hypothetical protein
MSIWSGKTFEITKTWGDDRWLKPGSAGGPSFRLCCYEGGVLPCYHVEFDKDKMNPCWTFAWLLDIGRGPAHQRKGKSATPIQVDRLEGFMQVPGDAKPRTDHVLIEYHRSTSGKLSDDLVCVWLQYADGLRLLEEGGGSGPPH